MNEFLLIFRRDFREKQNQSSPNEMQKHLEHWQQWFGSLKEENRLAAPLKRWDTEGKVVNKKGVTNGPYVEIKESIGGMILIKAVDYQDAAEVAQHCPILELGG